jgi:pimeloyl-ACP methyl ester carboxylesterase
VTLYLHGSVLGEPTWRFRGVAGHDHLRAMAERGHVSAAYDQLGYGRSDIPPGGRVCGGTQADVAHQVIGALRERFARVALFGFSFGGYAAELEALTFRDVDALAVESWSDHIGRPFYRQTFPSVAACGRGGEAKRPGAPGGYTYYFRHEDEHVMLANARPAVIAALHGAHERDPCGLTASAAQILRNRQAVGAIDVPVLLVYGKRDALFGRRAAERQRESFHGTDDLVYRRIARAGHFLTLERRHPAFRALVSRWLERRGF